MAEGSGFGKTILFGEHFVVYGLPGIASGISDMTIATITGSAEFEFVDERPETPGYKETKKEEIRRQVKALLAYFKVDPVKHPVRIHLAGNLKCASGVGASAALAASIARAFSAKLGLNLPDIRINEIAYMAEEAGSGKPSGIDNTCSVYGGFLTFEKNLSGGPNKIQPIRIKKPVEIVLINSGITQETKVVVDDVRRKKEADEQWFRRICGEYKNVFTAAVPAIGSGDWKTVGKLMDKNQSLLREIGVSCEKLETMIKSAKSAGAAGAKLTGTGRGGYVIALTPGKEAQESVAFAMEEAGYETLKTSIGVRA